MYVEWIYEPQAWIALITLTSLEIVLGIDNIIFLSILVGRVSPEKRQQARIIGLSLAMIMRILLLVALAWVMKLTKTWFSIYNHAISGRDVILILGGLFLIGKSTHEIHNAFEAEAHASHSSPIKHASFYSVMIQIALIDIIFSLDSVITAVGMADHLPVMILAVIIAVLVMMVAARPIGDFVDEHPTIKMLALSFLILIGVALLGEGLELHIPKGYIYFAMFFSVVVEMLNLRLRKKILGIPPSTPKPKINKDRE